MGRPRINDPLGVSDQPKNLVTDPARIDAVKVKFGKKLKFVEGSYRATIRSVGSDQDYNRSLTKLRRSLDRKRPAKRRGERAHPEIEMVILKHAMDHAAIRTGALGATPIQEDANFGAQKAAELLRPRAGRSSYRILRHYVRGLMALIQETTGRPVQLTHYKDNHYDPQAVNTGGRILVAMARQLEPSATASTITTIVKQARREFAGREMPFTDFFPTYGQDLGSPQVFTFVGVGHQVVAVLPFCPIYFP